MDVSHSGKFFIDVPDCVYFFVKFDYILETILKVDIHTKLTMGITKKQCKIIKRCMLCLALLPLLTVVSYESMEWSRTLYFIVPASGVATYVVLLNFPLLVKQVHSRPLYYDDLEDDRFVDPLVRKRFQFIFICILQITLTLIISGLIYYYYDRWHNTNLSKIEVFGVLGGTISLLLKIENVIGKITLTFINLLKHRSTIDASDHGENVRRMRANSLEMVAEV